MREPADPEPEPADTPADEGDEPETPAEPDLPDEPVPEPLKVPEDDRPPTPDGDQPPPDRPAERKKARARGKAYAKLLPSSWRFWWTYNRDEFLYTRQVRTGGESPERAAHFSSRTAGDLRTDEGRAMRLLLQRTILPALERRLLDPKDNGVHGSVLFALGRVGGADQIDRLVQTMYNRVQLPGAPKLDLHHKSTEWGAIGLGLLPALTDPERTTVRNLCLHVLRDPKTCERKKCYAAISLGIQGDRSAALPLMAALEKNLDKDPDIAAGILIGLGLLGADSVHHELEESFLTRRFRGKRLKDLNHSLFGYALAKSGRASSLPAVLKVLRSRRSGKLARRTAAIAAGVLGARAESEAQGEAVRALERFLTTAQDATARHFAVMALSRVGTLDAIKALSLRARKGEQEEKAFVALGLGVLARRAESAGTLTPPMRTLVLERLAELDGQKLVPDTRAALLLARGLARDPAVVETIVDILGRKKGDPMLRGYGCVALGLSGTQDADAHKMLKKIIQDDRRQLSAQAGTALSLLDQEAAVPLLLKSLQRAKSVTVKARLVVALGRVGGMQAAKPLIRLMENKKESAATRALAAFGLGLLGDVRAQSPLSEIARDLNYRAMTPALDALMGQL